MYTRIPISIIFRFGTNQTVIVIYIPHNDDTDTAYTGTLLIGRFKIYSGKILHEAIYLCYLLNYFSESYNQLVIKVLYIPL